MTQAGDRILRSARQVRAVINAGWQETMHLLASPKNAKRLAASIRQARADDIEDRMTDQRWLDLTAAATYLCLRPDIFARKVKAGIIPEPSHHLGERTPRWDRGALDAIMGAGTGSTNTREAVHALANQIAKEGRQNGSSHARRRHG